MATIDILALLVTSVPKRLSRTHNLARSSLNTSRSGCPPTVMQRETRLHAAPSSLKHRFYQGQRWSNIIVRLPPVELVDHNSETRISSQKQLWPLTRLTIMSIEEDFHADTRRSTTLVSKEIQLTRLGDSHLHCRSCHGDIVSGSGVWGS